MQARDTRICQLSASCKTLMGRQGAQTQENVDGQWPVQRPSVSLKRLTTITSVAKS